MRSSACMLWGGKTRLEWSWTTQLSLYFSSWIDSTYRWVSQLKLRCNRFERLKPGTAFKLTWPQTFSVDLCCRLLKPRPQFSSCAASACTCPRTSWPAGVWETSRITSAHTCQIKASSSTQPHREKPLPFLLPKPSEANWCTHLHPFPFKRFELVLGSLLFSPFLLPTRSPLPGLRLIQFPSLFFSQRFPSSLCHHFCWLPHFFCFILVWFFLPLYSLPTHSSILVYLNLHEHWFWVVGCSLGAALSTAPVIEGTLYVASEQEQTIPRSSRWFSDGRVLYPCCHKKGLLKLVCNVIGVSRTTLHNLLTKDRCEQVLNHL